MLVLKTLKILKQTILVFILLQKILLQQLSSDIFFVYIDFQQSNTVFNFCYIKLKFRKKEIKCFLILFNPKQGVFRLVSFTVPGINLVKINH